MSSIIKVTESEGHSAFYFTISVTLAVLLYPSYAGFQSYVSSGFGVTVDYALVIAGVSGGLTGLFYFRPPDKIVDWYILNRVQYDRWTHGLPYQERNIHRDLKKYIGYVDFVVSSWRDPTWLTTDQAAENAAENAINDTNVQKEIWRLKNRAVVGFTFLLWSIILGVNRFPDRFILLALTIVGSVMLVYPWFTKEASDIPGIIKQLATVRYASDNLATWRPRSRENQQKKRIQELVETSEKVETVIAARQWPRLTGYYNWLCSELNIEHNAARDYKNRFNELVLRIFVDFHDEESVQKRRTYNSALSLFKNHRLADEHVQKFEIGDVKELGIIEEKRDNIKTAIPYYRGFYQDVSNLLMSLDRKSKIQFINTYIGCKLPITNPLGERIYEFVNQLQSDEIEDQVYWYFLTINTIYPQQTTVFFIEEILKFYDSSSNLDLTSVGSQMVDFLSRIVQDSDTDETVLKRIYALHSEFKYRFIWKNLKKSLGSDWKSYFQ